ncbi:MAG: NADH-quinone oxidoreductase subunit [Chthoniobacter sp.]|jgi:NADH-quinone oxidoreductase subunit H|nr:NADH-quinone oxidoreductase subunit [Chthoniobacter sp.]
MDTLLSLDWFLIATSLAKTVFVLFFVVLPMVSYTVYAERRVSALIQDRVGPNRTGFPTTLLGFKKDISPFLGGLGQPIADAVKLLTKEDFTPAHVNKFYYWIAPGLGIAAVIVTLAVIPFGSSFLGVPMVIANVNVGPLFIFAISSLSVYGIVLAGWSANSKYSFLGGIRSSSQMISYELALGLSVVPLFMILGRLNLPEIVNYQRDHGWLLVPFTDGHLSKLEILLWIPICISFFVFTISMFAETNRLPFDLPEAEQELVGGYHTEYSSMKFALFFLGEYAAMIAGSSLVVTLFLGGWHLPFIPDGAGQGGLEFLHRLPSWIWGLVNITAFFAKVGVLLLFFIWVRWTLPRFRYDQLMRLGWIFFFEIALVNVFVTAGILALFPN